MPITSDATTVTITHPSSSDTSVKILKYGATILSWKVNGAEKLFLSESAHLDGSKPVRGGIPLVFPRFGPAGKHAPTDKLPQHGFARRSTWEFLGETDEVSAQFALSPDQLDAESRKDWPYDFTLIYTVKLASPTQLALSMDVENPGKEAFDFNVLFHTYFRVPDISKVSITGLQNVDFWNTRDSVAESGKDKPITIAEEVDRVYKNSPDTVEINSDNSALYTVKASPTLTDTVVWNPWSHGAEALADFSPNSGYKQTVCVEDGNVGKFTSLEPTKKWNGSVVYSAH